MSLLSSLINKKKRAMLNEMMHYHKLSQKHGKDLSIVQDNTANIKAKDIILFVTMRNELIRMPFFLDYYRNLGVQHFVIVDNDSEDGLLAYLKDFDDISVWHTTASYKKSNFGMHWLNHLLKQYGTGHWCLTCDPDEFLVYPHMESRTLRDLTNMLDQHNQPAFFTIMLDMYSDKPVSQTVYESGDNPFEAAPYFDKVGYVGSISKQYLDCWVQGGVRRRVFFSQMPENSPALNKTPLVKWGKYYSYISSMHTLVPAKLNRGFNGKTVTGNLCHFKFFDTMLTKAKEEMTRKQHYANSREYQSYNKKENDVPLYNPSISIAFDNWEQLVEMGLMKNKKWGG